MRTHFSQEHNMTVMEYFEKFRGKLRMPKLERLKVTKTILDLKTTNSNNNNNNSSSLKRKMPEALEVNGKKRKSI